MRTKYEMNGTIVCKTTQTVLTVLSRWEQYVDLCRVLISSVRIMQILFKDTMLSDICCICYY